MVGWDAWWDGKGCVCGGREGGADGEMAGEGGRGDKGTWWWWCGMWVGVGVVQDLAPRFQHSVGFM